MRSNADIGSTENDGTNKPSCRNIDNGDNLTETNNTNKASCNHMHNENDPMDSIAPNRRLKSKL